MYRIYGLIVAAKAKIRGRGEKRASQRDSRGQLRKVAQVILNSVESEVVVIDYIYFIF